MTDEFLEKVNGMVIPESLRKCESRCIKKIEEIAKKYNNVKVLNYGNREYDDYFLFDVMHAGMRGWMEVGRELYKFEKQN